MTEKGVRQIVYRLIHDQQFQKAFNKNPKSSIIDAGYQINQVELIAIEKVQTSKMQFNIEKSHSHEIQNYDISNHVKAS